MWKKKKPAVSIIIPVYDAVEYTLECLNSLDTTLATTTEIIIVDNASTDGTKEHVASFNFKNRFVVGFHVLRNNKNLGYAIGCNQGFASSRGDYIVFLNNDIMATRHWLEPLLACFATDRLAGMVTPKLLYPHSRRVQYAGVYFLANTLPHILFYRKEESTPGVNLQREVPAAGGGCMVISRHVLETVGLFDEKFKNGLEDIDLSLRIKQHGFKNIYCPRSVLYHYESMTKGRADHSEENIRYYLHKWADMLHVENGDIVFKK